MSTEILLLCHDNVSSSGEEEDVEKLTRCSKSAKPYVFKLQSKQQKRPSQTLLNSQSQESSGIPQDVAKLLDNQNSTRSLELALVVSVVKENLPIRFMDTLTKVLKSHVKDSKAVKKKTCLARLMLAIQIYITGDQETIRQLRQGLVHRSLLMLVLLLRSISPAVRRRYPNLESLVLDGVMTRKEKQSFESIVPVVNLFWVPATWFATALQDAFSDGMLTNEYGTKLIMEEFLEFRANCGALWSYNWVSIPIIYTQVCTLSTYSYFIACLVARQYTGPSHQSLQDIDIVLPIGTVMELVCYVGLLKVAEQIKNPFGDSDEDFDLNFLITRHLRTVHLGLDDLDVNCPPLTDASSGKAASNGAGDSLQLMPGQLLQNERHTSELIKY
ncbi:bestrophin-1-like [Daphnia magna]|uniref:bestrophin-1-like n=1 Tax=Daphnia magna TaxID=35525 RepID=UPI001E1BCE59|nr:bestrophin-1-like [Daphnia magna]